MTKIFFGLVAGFILFTAIVEPAAAQTSSCSFAPGQAAKNTQVALQMANLTAGNSIPNGTILYSQQISSGSAINYDCATTGLSVVARLVNTPAPQSSWSGGPFASGAIYYATGIPGISVGFRDGDGNVVQAVGAAISGGAPVNAGANNFNSNVTLYLIKTGDIAPGSLAGNLLPTVDFAVTTNGGGAPFTLWTIAFIGQINVTAQSCQVSDVHVAMGRHAASEMKGAGTGTAWVPFNIALSNCPAFYGNYRSNAAMLSAVNVSCGDNGICSPASTPDANRIAYRLDPNNAALLPAQDNMGLVTLDATGTDGSPGATGVAIQIADGVGENPVPLRVSVDADLNLSAIGGGTYLIPLQARYYQTGAAVTAGQANATVTVTITYQ
jgi:type 1 fimbria pilin